ncbi:MAG: LamG domain-containing protein, partial [Candidatus Poribacteria bacterium]
FDEGSGDVAGNTVGDDGVLVGSPAWVNGHTDGALEFDGTTNYVEIPLDLSPQAPGNGGQLSICAWVNVLATETDAHGQTRQPILLKGGGDEWEYALYVYDDFGAGMSVWNCAGSGVAEPSAPGTLPQGEWHHTCGTFDITDGIRVYVDGVEVAEAAPNAEEPCDGSTFPRVGSRVDGQFLNALIDEVAVWNRALTVDEVIQNMATALSTPVEPQGKLATSWGMTKRAY